MINYIHVETIFKPSAYSQAQIDLAFAIHHFLDRGKFVLVEPPRKP